MRLRCVAADPPSRILPAMNAFRKAIFAAVLAFGCLVGLPPVLVPLTGAALAAPPPPVPALPDTERRTTYTLSAQTGPFAVGFAIYGDSTDYQDWITVWLNGVLQSSSTYVLTSPTGGLATIPRPITDATITFNSATTGTVQIVGARRPRRTTQFTQGAGIGARDFNQVFSDLTAVLREQWDKLTRTVTVPPGETLSPLPPGTTRANNLLGFDGTGNLALYVPQLPGAVQSANTIYAGPASGAAAVAAFRALVGADLPVPSLTTLGGVQAKAAVASNWLRSLGTDGVLTASQPAFPDISGSVAAAQLPNPTATTLGGVKSKASVASNFLTQIGTDGSVSQAQPGFADISGAVASTQMPAFSGDVSTSAGATVTAIGANKVTNAQLRQSGALALIGRSANSTGNVADIQATAASDCVFRESASTVGCGTVATGGLAAGAVTNAKLANSGLTLGSTGLTLGATTSSVSGLTLAGPTFSGTVAGAGTVPNGVLVNAATTVNGQTCTLGSTCTITATAGSVTVGTTTVTTGTPNGLLYDNAGVLGNLATANNGVLVTSVGGVPSVTTTLPSGLTVPSPTITTAFTATGLVTNGSLAAMAANTVKGSVAGGAPADLTASQVRGVTEQGSTLLNVLVASSSANLSDTTSFTSSYDDYFITFDNIVPVTDAVGLNCQVKSGGSFQATGYANVAGGPGITTAVDISNSNSISNTSTDGLTAQGILSNVNSTSAFKYWITRQLSFLNSSLAIVVTNSVGAWRGGAGAITGIQCQMTSGNIASGTIKIYGLRNAL